MEREERTCEFDEEYFYGLIKIATAMTLALNYEPERMTEFNDRFHALRCAFRDPMMASRLSANGTFENVYVIKSTFQLSFLLVRKPMPTSLDIILLMTLIVSSFCLSIKILKGKIHRTNIPKPLLAIS